MKILVTGGAGFIGSHVVALLLSRGHDVVVLDNLSTGKKENLPECGHQGPRLIVGDIRDAACVEAAVHGREAVLHLAAQVSVQVSVQDPPVSASHNLTGFVQVLDAARRHGVRRFVYASSAAVFGTPAQLPLTDESPAAPISPYGLEKWVNERYAALFSQLYGIQTFGLRFFNVYGPRQDPSSPYAGVISKFCSALASNQPLTIFGDGLQTRDFVYVGDVARVCADALEGGQHGVVSVGTGHSVTLLELAAALQRAAGTQVQLQHEAARAGDIRHSAMRPLALEQALGWTPQTPLQEGLEQLWSWFATV